MFRVNLSAAINLSIGSIPSYQAHWHRFGMGHICPRRSPECAWMNWHGGIYFGNLGRPESSAETPGMSGCNRSSASRSLDHVSLLPNHAGASAKGISTKSDIHGTDGDSEKTYDRHGERRR